MSTPFYPVFTLEQARENHVRLVGRRAAFMSKGLDLIASRASVLSVAEPISPPVLEIGTGNGHLALALAVASHTLISVDPDPEALSRAAMNLAMEGLDARVTLFRMDAAALEFESGSVGTLFCVDAFHHMPDPSPILASMDRVLHSGGKMVLSDFNDNGLALVGEVHREEGRVHENHGIRAEWVADHIRALGYSTTDHPSPHRWTIVAVKPG